MKVRSIDVNADVGEGVGNETLLMPYLSSCNIACGGHAGDIESMTNVVRLAKSNQVKIGAHPSFSDRLNFGRTVIEMSPSDLYTSLKAQIERLQVVARAEGVVLNHIKPHGALYNLAAKDEETARVILKVLKAVNPVLKLYAPCNSVMAKIALLNDVELVYEAFADRGYEDDLSLVSREKKGAVLHDKDCVFNRVLRMVKDQKITTINRVEVATKISTICVHGDTENAVEIVKYLVCRLKENNISIQ
ncbi:5-oxoprolinase subunit PxpA [Winogradskyella rapida]|uniref:5-oxoprolinase subunit PxpA n=1 Tax=Winogradskyella rapida TaxID=549701 RepID=A0ABW3KR60_9FLAO